VLGVFGSINFVENRTRDLLKVAALPAEQQRRVSDVQRLGGFLQRLAGNRNTLGGKHTLAPRRGQEHSAHPVCSQKTVVPRATRL